MIEICQIWRKKAKQNSAGNGGFRRERSAAVSLRAVTLLWAEIMHVLLLVSKSGTSGSPL